jgi:hypothetical protein
MSCFAETMHVAGTSFLLKMTKMDYIFVKSDKRHVPWAGDIPWFEVARTMSAKGQSVEKAQK